MCLQAKFQHRFYSWILPSRQTASTFSQKVPQWLNSNPAKKAESDELFIQSQLIKHKQKLFYNKILNLNDFSLELKFQYQNNDIIIMRQFKNQSIPLVRLSPETNKLQLTLEAKKYLENLRNPVAVISIAGLYRTGKSFLINKLIPAYSSSNASQSIFRVGMTTQSTTKGLHILSSPITLQCEETGQNIDYLIIDSEGLGSFEQSSKYDTNILILIFLLSSTVVYNSMGAIDEGSLQQLQVVLQLKKCIENQERQYQSCSYKQLSEPPKFIWILRDFALQLIDRNGNEISSDEYLEQCLQQSASSTPEAKKKNEIRRAIKENLGERHCFTLVRPTLKEQDLQHLCSNKHSKIRSQFLGQLQCIKQVLFTRNISDIKKVSSEKITGKLFVRILSEYVDILNNDRIPVVLDVWNSVMKQDNEEYFNSLIDQVKKQLKSIKLPIPKQDLKLKINEIQNRYYKRLQKKISNKDQLRQYNKEYIAIVQRLNKQLKQSNSQMYNNNLLYELQKFTKANLLFQTIQPFQVVLKVKQFIERIKFKINGSPEGYEYLLNILQDIFFVIEQKSGKVHREHQELSMLVRSLEAEKSNLDLSLINLKREYHDSLKTIAKMQQGQADIDKNYSLTKNKVLGYETKIIKLQSQLKQEKLIYDRSIKEAQEKYRHKVQELSNELKKLREENTILEEALRQSKQQLSQQHLQTKKQNIFEAQMKQSFDKFHREKVSLQKQIDQYKKQVNQVHEKYSELKDLYEKQCEKQKNTEENYLKKQQNFLKQFQSLKQTIKQTKASYEKTYETYHTTGQKINVLAQPSTSKKEKYLTPAKDIKPQQNDYNVQQNNRIMKKYYETEMEKLQQEHKLQVEELEKRIIGLQKQLERKQIDKQTFYLEAKEYKEKCFKLQSDINYANAKFNEVLKDIEQAKQKQRSLYEESIVRLLNNIQKRDRQNRDCSTHSVSLSGLEDRSTMGSSYINKRKQKYSENIKDSLSFGTAFQTK